MADRIFINKDSGQYSERELNRIDWSQVRDGMVKARKAANAGKNLNPFGMVTGLLDTRLAQLEGGKVFESPVMDMPEEPGDESRIQMIADAVATGQDLDTEDAQFGLDNVESVAAKAGLEPEEVAATLQDYVGLNIDEVPAEEGGIEDSTSEDGSAMETFASRIAKKKLPAALEKFKFKQKGGDNPEKHKGKDKEEKDDDEDGAEAMLRKGNEHSDEKVKVSRKIVFTSPAQLSAAAVEAARAAGDEELVRATLAARAERRVAIGQLAAEATLEQITREAKSRRRAATATKVEKPKEVKANVKTDKTTTGEDFVKPTELSTGQKSAFASKARELGFPERYITALLGTRNANTVTEDDVRNIAEGPGKYQEKVERVAAMIREAKLDEANRNRIVKFWVEELGYPADYISKMVEDYQA
jgi:hypothetical protein